MFDAREYRPPGPVATAFLRDREHLVRWLMGPIGSGKTHTCFFDALTVASEMPICKDGIKRFKGFVFRDTYTKLWDTVIPSWWQWFPQTMGEWSGAKGRQASHHLRFDLTNGLVLDFVLEFRALDDSADIEAVLKGLEGSWAYLNEGDTLNQEVLKNILGRILQRRYPPQRLLPDSAFSTDASGERTPAYFAGVVGDMNPPDVDNYTYHLFEELRPPGYKIYKQPSGRSPQGENRAGVSLQSYLDIAKANAHDPGYVKRMVDGLYGPSRDGLPVFAEFQDDIHVAPEDLLPLPGVPLRLGFDQGVTGPAMVVAQYTYQGQLRILDELVPKSRIGATAFGRQCAAFLQQRYPNMPVQSVTCDMAGFVGGDKETGDHAWAETVSEALGMALLPAATNELSPRHDVIRQLLTTTLDGRAPCLLLSPRCGVLRKGFNSGYHWTMVGVGKNAVPSLKPHKGLYSNPHDALQYLALDIFGVHGVVRGEPSRRIGQVARQDRDDEEASMPSRDLTSFDVFSS